MFKQTNGYKLNETRKFLLNLEFWRIKNCHQPNLHASRDTLSVTNWQTLAQGADIGRRCATFSNRFKATFSFCVLKCAKWTLRHRFPLSWTLSLAKKCVEYSSKWNLPWVRSAMRRKRPKFSQKHAEKPLKWVRQMRSLVNTPDPVTKKWINLNENRATCVEMTALSLSLTHVAAPAIPTNLIRVDCVKINL